MKKKIAFTTIATVFIGSQIAAQGVTPATSSGNPGYIGLSAFYGAAVLYSGNSIDETGQTQSGTIDGAFSFPLWSGRGVVEGSVTADDYSEEYLFNRDTPGPSIQIGGHYLVPRSDGSVVGAFAAYGRAPRADNDATELYQFVLGGAEIVKPVGQDITAFAQAAYGTSLQLSNDHPGGPLSSAGFYDGFVVRAGVTYTGLSNALITLEGEHGRSAEYEDDDEPGEFWTIALTGEMPLSSDGAWVGTAEARFSSFNALNDDNRVEEATLSLGVRYMFGGSSSRDLLDAGMIGLPYIPLRASVWTPALD